MIVVDTKRRQAVNTINAAARASEGIRQPMGGWIALFQSALGLSSSQLAKDVSISRNSLHKSLENEKAGSISLNQLSKIADAMGGQLVYAIVPKQGDVEGIVMQQARKKAKRIILRTRSHMALEEQSEGLGTQDEMIEELAIQMARELKRGFWS
jgi:predicted DNA-binding mobile mystery protein A